MEPIHVLVLMPAVDRSGVQRITLNYMRKIDSEKIKYDFLVCGAEKCDYEDEIKSMGGLVYYMSPLHTAKTGAYKKEFRRFLSEHREYEVVHSYLEEKSYYALRIAQEMNIPIRICHGQLHPAHVTWKSPLKYYRKYRLRKYYTHGMACSKEVAQWLFGPLKAKDTVIMKNAVDTTALKKDMDIEREIRQEYGLDDKLVIGNVGKFVKENNQKFLVDIFAEIHRRRPDSVLVLAGDGDSSTEQRYKDKVKERVKEMRLEASVIFAGVKSDIERVMHAFDVVVMPSASGGFPISLVEAQSMGIKCVVSDVVTQKCNLTGSMQFMPLELRASVWAGRILQYVKEPVVDKSYKVVDKGYDIKSSATKLQRYYISELKKYNIQH